MYASSNKLLILLCEQPAEYITPIITEECKDGQETRIMILFAWDNLDRARQFVQSEDLRQAMQRAGVADQPDIYLLEEVERVSV
jgi:hypothetical protein